MIRKWYFKIIWKVFVCVHVCCVYGIKFGGKMPNVGLNETSYSCFSKCLRSIYKVKIHHDKNIRSKNNETIVKQGCENM